MRKDIVRANDFNRRAVIVGGVKGLLFTALGARLYYLQISESEKYQLLADGNRIRLNPVLPKRGKILDKNGNILADGNPRYRVLFDPPSRKRKNYQAELIEVLNNIAEIMNLDIEKQNKILKKIEKDKRGKPVLIEDYLTWEQVTKIEVNSVDLPGVSVSVPEVRNYHYGAITSHVIGYTGKPSEKDVQISSLYNHPEIRIGKAGIEKSMEASLRGKAGVKQIEVDSRSRFVRELEEKSGVAGENLTLTLDIELQKYVTELLTGKGGFDTEGASVVVMDIATGAVLAMVSVPTYDANRFIRGIKPDYWKELLGNIDSPLINKTIMSQYPPGSTFKMITALAALEAGAVTEHTTAYCPGYYEYGGRKFHCWQRHGHGNVNLEMALAKSCNVYFYKLSTKVGVDNISDMAQRFGLGHKTGIELPSEKSGLMPTKAWKLGALGKPWYNGETLNASIGQGFALSTPLQLAVMTSRIASRGKMVTPHIIESVANIHGAGGEAYEFVTLDNGEAVLLPKKTRQFADIDIHPWHIESVLRGMNSVVNNPEGAVYKNRIKEEGFEMGGKTGTAQVLSNRRFKHTPKKAAERYHALFVGYAPVSKPRYAVSVLVEHGGYGSVVAAPLAKKILLHAQKIGAAD